MNEPAKPHRRALAPQQTRTRAGAATQTEARRREEKRHDGTTSQAAVCDNRGDQLARAGGAGRGCQRRGCVRPRRQVVATPNTNTPTDVILRGTSAPRMRWTRQNRTQPRHPKHQEYWKWTWSKEAAAARGALRSRREGHAPSSSPGEVSGRKATKHQNRIKNR